MPRHNRLVRPPRGRVIAFDPPHRRSAGSWREAARGLGPIGLALPLAAFCAVMLWGGGSPSLALSQAAAPSTARDPESAHFTDCRGRRGENCTIDGDSLMYRGRQIRVADIDTPEIGSPKCPKERARGQAAEARFQALLNAGPFSLEPVERARDRFGRELFVITREGRSLGDRLIDEGLAHPWVGHKLPWC